MRARRKSPDADPVRIEIVLGSVGAKPANLLRLINLVDFYQADADGVVIAPDDRGEGA